MKFDEIQPTVFTNLKGSQSALANKSAFTSALLLRSALKAWKKQVLCQKKLILHGVRRSKATVLTRSPCEKSDFEKQSNFEK